MGEPGPPRARPTVVIVLVIMWIAPTVVTAALAFNTWQRWQRNDDPLLRGGNFWEATAFTAAALVCGALAVGAWRMRRGAWWVMLVVIASGLAAAASGLVWGLVGVATVADDADDMETYWPSLVIMVSVGSLAVLVPGLVVVLSPNSRRAFLGDH